MNSLKHLKNLGGLSLLLFFLCSSSYRILPVVSINGMTNGAINAIAFSKSTTLDIHSKRNKACNIEFYTLYHISLSQDITILKGTECSFSPNIQQTINNAKKGDKYIFINVKVRCEGDNKAIKVNPLNFNIK